MYTTPTLAAQIADAIADYQNALGCELTDRDVCNAVSSAGVRIPDSFYSDAGFDAAGAARWARSL